MSCCVGVGGIAGVTEYGGVVSIVVTGYDVGIDVCRVSDVDDAVVAVVC